MGRHRGRGLDQRGKDFKPLADFRARLEQLHAGLRAEPPRFNARNPNVSTVLYNGMIAPLVPFAIKGAIWYQGEVERRAAPGNTARSCPP